MKQYALILENDPKSLSEITKVLAALNPELAIIEFQQMSQFKEWRDQATQNGIAHVSEKETATSAKKNIISIVIACREIAGPDIVKFLTDFQEMLIDKGFCMSEEKTPMVITAYDKPEMKLSSLQSHHISNVMFKPFDFLILQQHLAYALSGHHKSDNRTIASQKTSTEIEMLKDINITGFDEMGFTTASDREIPVGRLGKYYGVLSPQANFNNAFARCKSCEPSDKPGEFKCYFEFVSMETHIVSSIKKLLASMKAETRDIAPASSYKGQVFNFIFISSDDFAGNIAMDHLKNEFHLVNFYRFPDMNTFAQSIKDQSVHHGNDQLRHIDGLFIEQDHIIDYGDTEGKKTKEILNKIRTSLGLEEDKKLPVFLLSNRRLSDSLIRATLQYVEDIFLQPLDRNYLIKVVYGKIPQLIWKNDPLKVKFASVDHRIQAVNMIKAVELSEAAVVVEYSRPLSPGSFRNFVLWMPDQPELPQLLAVCNYVEEKKVNNTTIYLTQFVFYGIRDNHLKYIRIWIRHNHVISKKESQ